MTIQEGIKLKGRPAEIPGASRNDLPQFFKDMGYKVGAEIGVCQGKYTEQLCQAGLKMYAVDSWQEYDGYKDYYKVNPKYKKSLDVIYAEARERLKNYDCEIIKKSSMEAVKDFENNSLDFVYIDGNHDFRHVAEDLFEWSQKVKVGGVIAGHDYFINKNVGYNNNVHVKPVVHAFTDALRIKDWWVLGERYAPDRDEWRTFFWFRNV